MRTLLVAAWSLALLGCASSAPPIDTTQISELRKGQTTVSEVVRRFGRPSLLSRNTDGTQTASYLQSGNDTGSFAALALATSGITGVSVDSVIFEFDTRGILTDYRTTRSTAGANAVAADTGKPVATGTAAPAQPAATGSAAAAASPARPAPGNADRSSPPSWLPSSSRDLRELQ